METLKQLGASQHTIDVEQRRLWEFEKALFLDFRQDILKRIKRQSARATVIKESSGSATNRRTSGTCDAGAGGGVSSGQECVSFLMWQALLRYDR